MKPSAGDFIHHYFADLDVLDCAQLVVGVLLLASIISGVLALVRVCREGEGDGTRPSMSALRRWIGAITALSLVSCGLAVVVVAYHHWVTHAIIGRCSANTLPADISNPLVSANLGLASGLLIGVVGLALGWTLEWFADGIEKQASPEQEG